MITDSHTPGTPASAHRHVLVADDDATTRRMLSGLLESLGAKVALAEDGEAAVAIYETDKASTDPINIVFLDMRMPKLSGAQTAHALREKGYKGPIFVFTAAATVENKHSAEAAGVTRYFAKAVLKKALLGALLEEYCK